MATDCILAHDVGTSGTKTSIVLPNGTIAASHTSSHGTEFPKPGWAQQRAEDWWEGVCRNTQALVAQHPGLATRIAGVGVSGHMLGCVAMGADGIPLCPAVIHSDCRSSAEARTLDARIGANALYETTGNILDARSPLAKILWIKNNLPDVYRRTERFIQSKDYVVGCMVGEFDSTDCSDASHAQWIDIRRKEYATDALAAAGIDIGKFPVLHRSTDVVGHLAESAARALGLSSGIPVVAGGGDGVCASAGAGSVLPGDTYCCIGTTAWICAVTPEPMIDAQNRIFNIVALDGETCGVYGTVQAAGRSVDWVKALIGEQGFDRFDELLEQVEPGSAGLLFLPYLEGERSPIFDTDARGVFFGLTPAHGRLHVLRATIEGVSFALRSVLDVMREAFPIPSLRLIGGGGQSSVWRQLLADVCDVRVQTLSTEAADATSLGAAITAGVGVGLFADFADGVKSIGITSERAADSARARTYNTLLAVYQALYPHLKPVYGQLRDALAEIDRG